MDNKLSELKDALEFLETTEFDGEWDSALVGGENGKNYHAVINANDVVVRADDDSRHTSWLCDYLEAVSPVNIRALLAELEAKDKHIADMEHVVAAAKCDDELWDAMAHRLKTLEAVKADASQVFKEIGNELGCNPDNESIMMAIDDLKKREKRVVALAGGNAELWETMAARLEAAEKRLATPVRLPERYSINCGVCADPNGDWLNLPDAIATLREQGFTVEGDEQS